MIKQEVSLISQTYALPVYSEAFVATDNGETLEISISSTLFLDTLLCQLRGKIITYSKNLKKQETAAEDTLVSSIENLQEELDSDNDNIFKKNLLETYLCNCRIYERKKLRAA